MKALWQIILTILWRLRPVQALEVNLRDVIDMALAMFADEAAIDDITHDPAYRNTLAAAFFDAHRKLDLLIYLRACEIAGIRPRIASFKPDYSHTSSSADLMKLWRSFLRLLAKFDDYERYAIKRAERLRADENDYPPPSCSYAAIHLHRALRGGGKPPARVQRPDCLHLCAALGEVDCALLRARRRGRVRLRARTARTQLHTPQSPPQSLRD